MKNIKTVILALIVLLSASVFLPAVNAHVLPMVQFSANVSGGALVVYFPPGSSNPASNYVGIGMGMFSVTGQAYLPQGAVDHSAFTQGILLRDNRLMATFGGQTLNVRFRADPSADAIFMDTSPNNDLFILGINNLLLFYGTYRNATGTYSMQGTAIIYSVLVTFTQSQTVPSWALIILLFNQDATFLAQVIWVPESVDAQVGPSTIVTIPAASWFVHSVDFIPP